MRLRTVFIGVYAGMILNFVLWILMGWSEIRLSHAGFEIPAGLAVAAIFSIPSTIGVYAASRYGGKDVD